MQLRGDGEVYLQPALPQDPHDASQGQVPQHTVRGIVLRVADLDPGFFCGSGAIF